MVSPGTELIRRMATGDRDALAPVYDLYAPAGLRSPSPHAAGRGRGRGGAAGVLLGALARGGGVRPAAGLARGVGDGARAEPGNRPGAPAASSSQPARCPSPPRRT